MSSSYRNCHCASPARGGGENSSCDAEQAIAYLSRKVRLLTEVVEQYMLETSLPPERRAARAEGMARALERIVGGHPVAPSTYPECCLIGDQRSNGSFDWYGAGVLIHPRVVLCAAHCGRPTRVALGIDDLASIAQAEIVAVQRATVHPDYSPAFSPYNDISVLVLRQAAKTTAVPVASTAEMAAAECATLVGFGYDAPFAMNSFGVKREIEVGILAMRRTAGDLLEDAEAEWLFEADLEFIAGGDGMESCHGDSGGPAYIYAGNQRKVAGLTARPAGVPRVNPICGAGGIYTRVDVHQQFIREVMSAFSILA
jgi:endonuclease G